MHLVNLTLWLTGQPTNGPGLSDASTSSSSSSIIPIAAGAAGGGALLLALVMLFVLRRRSNRMRIKDTSKQVYSRQSSNPDVVLSSKGRNHD